MVDPGIKKQIDDADYGKLMEFWGRYCTADNPMFQGDNYKYFKEVFIEKREQATANAYPVNIE